MELLVEKTIELDHAIEKVWAALTTSEFTQKYMFGSRVESNWEKGSDLFWKGEFQGQKFFLKGKIIEIDPPKKLVYTNFDPSIGLEDTDENYLEVGYFLRDEDAKTILTIITKNFKGDAARRDHSEKAWDHALTLLTSVLNDDQ